MVAAWDRDPTTPDERLLEAVEKGLNPPPPEEKPGKDKGEK